MNEIFICPAPSPSSLKPDWTVPHAGFGVTTLERNGEPIWGSCDFDECDALTLRQLADWCGTDARWTLRVDGPMSGAVYELSRIWRSPSFIEWQQIETLRGFA